MIQVKRVVTPLGKGLKKALSNLDGKVGKVGWFEEDKYDDETPVASVAIIHEKGFPEKNIPARPFMRPTIVHHEKEWQEIAAQSAKGIISGKYDIGHVLKVIGEQAAGDIRKTISQIFSPVPQPATIQARLSKYKNKKHVGNLTKPLIDSTKMYESVTNTVEDK